MEEENISIENQPQQNQMKEDQPQGMNPSIPPFPQEKRGRKAKEPKAQRPESRARKFWRVVLGSMLGFFFASAICSFLGILMLIFALSSMQTSIPENSVLELTLDAPIAECETSNDFQYSLYGMQKSIGLDVILEAIEKAEKDKKIKGISLNITSVQSSPASLSEIRHALERFKKSGKFIYAYSDSYSQGAYYLASVADKVYLNPQGSIDFRGMGGQILFYKGLIDKLEVDVQVVKHGKYKSAVEPYFRENMSEENREQMEQLMNGIWKNMCDEISVSRKISVEQLNLIADSLLINQGKDALAQGMVDVLDYRPAYEKAIREKIGVPEKRKVTLVCLDEYKKTFENKTVKKSSDKIAVVYAVGEIIDGEGSETVIGSSSLSREIRRAAKDDKVKAIVLRVNSPGGSALASEVIWNEIEQAKAAGKKVVVSMGDYAASGGYYISCNADAIVAQPNTITGSIGVFGMMPNIGNFLSHKLGITIDKVTTNAHSDAFTGYRAMDETEYAYIQNSIEQTYATFLSRVAKGRNMQTDEVDSIGQGRVWTGSDAVKIGLVNQLGDLKDAIALAASKAGISKYEIVRYPDKKGFLDVFMGENTGNREIEAVVKQDLGDLYPVYQLLTRIRRIEGIQARMPMEIVIK